MYNECNMSDTAMLRVSSELKTKLKQKATAQGRTLEWMANEALSEFLLPKQINPTIQTSTPSIVKDNNPTRPTHYKPTDDWGA